MVDAAVPVLRCDVVADGFTVAQVDVERALGAALREVDEETVVVAELEHDGIVARGEGAPVDYWGETPETMIAASTPAMTTRKIPPATIQMVPDELRSAG